MNEIAPIVEHKVAGPFLKWAGGKGSLLSQLLPLFPHNISDCDYFEPFLGGGAVFFALAPRSASLFDVNHELIEVYKEVRDNVHSVILELSKHINNEQYYYDIRAQKPMELSSYERVARFIYLNRTCFNGLHRVNSRGQFNVPFGRYANPTICDIPTLLSASAALQGIRIESSDFETSVESAKRDDFVYFDPPYAPLSLTSSFTSYSTHRFDANEQRRLRNVVEDLTNRGVRVAVSNSSAPIILELYKGLRFHNVMARRAINRNGNGRGAILEYLITNY